MQDSCPLEFIARLTQAHDNMQLANQFCQIVQLLHPNSKINLFKINGCTKTPINHLSFDQIQHIYSSSGTVDAEQQSHDMTQVISCLNQEATISITVDDDGTSHRYIPISHSTNHCAVLLIQGRTPFPDAEDVLLPLTNIYANQLFLLEQNERDSLTGLLNRKALITFSKRLSVKHSSGNRHTDAKELTKPDYCLALMDLDHFKEVNDLYGHLYGDEVLLLMTNLMQQEFRDDDPLFRYGGEEFAVVLKNVSINTAEKIMDRFRQTVENHHFPQVGKKTISIGITELSDNILLTEAVHRADRALYYAKKNGRNRVCNYRELIASGQLAEEPYLQHSIDIF